MIGAAEPGWVATLKARVRPYRAVLIIDTQPEDIVAAAETVNTSYVHLRHPVENRSTRNWIRSVHKNKIGIILGSFDEGDDIHQILQLDIEAFVARRVDNFQMDVLQKVERYSSFGARSGFQVEGHAL